MDFRAALVRNVKPFVPANALVIPPATHKLAPEQRSANNEYPARESMQNTSQGESTSKRRRRRRRNNNAAKQRENANHHAGHYSIALCHPKEEEPDDLPTLRLLQASPITESIPDDHRSGDVELLRSVAERARERLAGRIQAYWEGKQQVIDAASKIQQAYSTHIECQLRAITDAMKTHLSQELDVKFVTYDDKQHYKLDATLAGIRAEMSHCHKQDGDALRNQQNRITALEVQVQAMMESMNGHRTIAEETRPPVEPDSASDIQQRIDQLYSLFHGLHRQHQDAMTLVREMQAFISSSGLALPMRPLHNVASGFTIDETSSPNPRIFPEPNELRKPQKGRALRPARGISSNPNLNKENVSSPSFVGNRSTSPMNTHYVMIEDLL
ncbi:hypothetical protein FRC19_008643 [Serendipita sp. 401]|nr:hypothetical protein FRC19_008643 [Serendipita sp. 401]